MIKGTLLFPHSHPPCIRRRHQLETAVRVRAMFTRRPALPSKFPARPDAMNPAHADPHSPPSEQRSHQCPHPGGPQSLEQVPSSIEISEVEDGRAACQPLLIAPDWSSHSHGAGTTPFQEGEWGPAHDWPQPLLLLHLRPGRQTSRRKRCAYVDALHIRVAILNPIVSEDLSAPKLSRVPPREKATVTNAFFF